MKQIQNRELKFRAWDNQKKKWLLGYEYPNLGGFSMIGEVMLFGEYTQMLNRFSLDHLDDIILTQYTGLKDKNGKDIYEGDIVKHKFRRVWKTEEHISTVIWDQQWCSYYLFDKNNSPHRMRDDKIHEVIGNIHTNIDN